MLITLTIMVFVVSLVVSLSGLYFFVEAPASRKRMRTRLAAMQQLFDRPPSLDPEVNIIREQLLSEIPALHRIMGHLPMVPTLQTSLHQAAVSMTVGTVLLISLGLAALGLVVGLFLGKPWLWAPVFALIPALVIGIKRDRRLAKFEEIFPDSIEMLARAVRAGHAFTTGFELIAKEMPDPVATEFLIAYEQQNMGLPLREALDNMAARVPLPDVRFFVAALQIQRESGGNLAEILDRIAYMIRERFKLLRQVKTYTAEGRMSLYILTAIPPVAALLLFIVNRDYIMTLFTDPLGLNIVAGAVVLQLIGYVVMRRITQAKV